MIKILVFIIILSQSIYSQSLNFCDSIRAVGDSLELEYKNNPPRFIGVYDDSPEPVGGFKVIQESIVYPVDAYYNCIEGTVLLTTVISKDGKARCSQILKGVHPSLDSCAIKAIESISWEPVLKNGKPIDFHMCVPVIFKLTYREKFKLRIHRLFSKMGT